MLAIHALNVNGGSDMLISPELVAQASTIIVPERAWLLRRPDARATATASTHLGFADEADVQRAARLLHDAAVGGASARCLPGAIIVYTTNGSTPAVDASVRSHQRHALHGAAQRREHDDACARGVQGGIQAVVRRGAARTSSSNDVINQSPQGQVPAGLAAQRASTGRR